MSCTPKRIFSPAACPDSPLQRAGHGDLVEARDGTPLLVYLCGRPLPNRGRCVLGRETAIQPMRWDKDGWLRTLDGQGLPLLIAESPEPVGDAFEPAPVDFNGPDLPIDFQWLRSPYPEKLFSLSDRPGHLRLYGRETLGSLFEQALVARRQQAFCYSVETVLDYQPRHYQQAAGLVCYYNGSKYHYLHVTHDEQAGRHVRVMSALPDSTTSDAFSALYPVADGPIHLRAEVDYERLRFAFRLAADADWTWIDGHLDASVLSDEATVPGAPNFTGAFVGMACQDTSGEGLPADFARFDYRERDFIAEIG